MNGSDTKNRSAHINASIESYDEVPYPSFPYPETHPNKLASTAILFGMTPPPVERCRVLELGCGSANNLIGMASELPDSEFIGIDLSENEVKIANQKINDLKFKNIQVIQKSITDITPDFGKFDYIIAHGVYSWVPENVREHILCVCRDNLNKNGLAYISYNTYPGWHLHEMLRNIMLYHTKDITDPKLAVKSAREYIAFLAEESDPTKPAGQFLKNEVERTQKLPDNYFFHDQLAEFNQPFYFHQFAKALHEHKLKYVRECDIQVSTSRNFTPKVAELLNNLGDDVVSIEQHLDFFLDRTFRETIICHQDIKLQRLVTYENITDLYFNSSLQPADQNTDLSNGKKEKFISTKCPEITSDDTLSKALWIYLSMMFPKPLPAKDITTGTLKILKDMKINTSDYPSDDTASQYVLANLLWGISMGFIQIYTTPSRVCINISKKPEVSALTRYDAARGTRVTNELHENINIDNFAHHVLPMLDGTNDFETIVEKMAALSEAGKINIKKNDKAITDHEELKNILKSQIQRMLIIFAKGGFLIG